MSPACSCQVIPSIHASVDKFDSCCCWHLPSGRVLSRRSCIHCDGRGKCIAGAHVMNLPPMLCTDYCPNRNWLAVKTCSLRCRMLNPTKLKRFLLCACQSGGSTLKPTALRKVQLVLPTDLLLNPETQRLSPSRHNNMGSAWALRPLFQPQDDCLSEGLAPVPFSQNYTIHGVRVLFPQWHSKWALWVLHIPRL